MYVEETTQKNNQPVPLQRPRLWQKSKKAANKRRTRIGIDMTREEEKKEPLANMHVEGAAPKHSKQIVCLHRLTKRMQEDMDASGGPG